MNFYLAQKLSIYHLASSVQTPPPTLLLSPSNLLSLLRAQIDLLIEQQIAATLWVKLPPGKIWHSEIQRYQEKFGDSVAIYTCHVANRGKVEQSNFSPSPASSSYPIGSSTLREVAHSKRSRAPGVYQATSLQDKQLSTLPTAQNISTSVVSYGHLQEENHTNSYPVDFYNKENSARFAQTENTTGASVSQSPNPNCIDVLFPPDSKIRREYFLIVLSPQFCSLTVAHRVIKSQQNLLAINTIEGKIIQPILNGIQQAITAESLTSNPLINFICPKILESELIHQLLVKQLQRQKQINHEIKLKQILRLKRQKQMLNSTLQFKDEFLNNVCQELRTPLTHMKTALSLLNSPTLKNSQRQRYLQMLNQECDRQTSLINGVRELMQIERDLQETTLELLNLADVVPGVVSTYQPLTQEKGIMLAYTVSTELPPVWCVSGGLRQIVIHLLSNSIKFTPCGGQVWVKARTQGDFVLLEFRDTGIGIAESEISKIFDRFYRVRSVASEEQGGSGLGLTIVLQLLERCGGSLTVKSKPSEGSTFTVQLARGGKKATS
ncbi:DICT sensory domain-containing protein [Chlorogloeopsis sp. ULAP01]|uniref:DICT sensory domain-containing protein n=1 Tax=Chlorogloeopsis sp. ULAP01 TaxID=3056483 RepID=UPI0025AB5BA4|nr:DICT sensory domain-containing protein [Chlorogloeopsis sp. ULAP01]MDM9385271.1 DICT sensory domain-containing protein [Chlorogloeopsis sp. ULAP01]